MPDVDERLDHVEQKLKDLGERIDERFGQVDERFGQIDERFGQIDERFGQVDQRFAQVDQRFDRGEDRIDSLAADVQKLRVLGERSEERIKLVAEVQAHHGSVLDEIKEGMEPLKGLRPLFEQVARDHEKRIAALEGARPLSTDARSSE